VLCLQNIAKRGKKVTKNNELSTRVVNAARRTNLIQIRVNDDDWAVVTAICDKFDVKPSALGFEFFQYALEQYRTEQQGEAEATPETEEQLALFNPDAQQ
jgi:hypothetical protein